MVRIRNKQVSIPRLYERKPKLYSIDEVLSRTIFEEKLRGKYKYKQMVDFDGELINMASDRYKCFALYGTDCVDCGIEGQYFAMERQGNLGRFHFNLYAIDEENNEILMTKDHITPVCRGGKDEITNYQPMCTICNNKKGSLLPEAYEKIKLLA